MKLVIYTDGASRGNPGPAAYGFTISDHSGNLLHEEGEYIGITTNNVAEYTSFLAALKKIKDKFYKHFPVEIKHYADSRLLVEQLSGRFKIKSPHLKAIVEQIWQLEKEIGEVTHQHIPREQNKLADKLANLALDRKKPGF